MQVVDFTAGTVRLARRMLPTPRVILAATIRMGSGLGLLLVARSLQSPLLADIFGFAGKAMLFLSAYGLVGHAEGVLQEAVARRLGFD
jgi:hypothetical protein